MRRSSILTVLLFFLTRLIAQPADSSPPLLLQKKESNPEFVTTRFCGGLGNQMFQVAVACAIAWDHGTLPSFSDIKKLKKTYRSGVFSRFDQRFPSDTHPYSCIISELEMMNAGCVLYIPNMKIAGYFQKVHYFEKYEKKLKEYFKPTEEDLDYLQKRYKNILSHRNSVGVQIRYYHDGKKNSSKFVQYGADYLRKAASLFPKSSLFVISSNNIDFAKRCWPFEYDKVYFISEEKDYLEMYLLSMCKHNIISNSSFGFWSAWLNNNPQKIVVRPKFWVGGMDHENITPKKWISIDAQYN
jgi:hypothetical protein